MECFNFSVDLEKATKRLIFSCIAKLYTPMPKSCLQSRNSPYFKLVEKLLERYETGGVEFRDRSLFFCLGGEGRGGRVGGFWANTMKFSRSPL